MSKAAVDKNSAWRSPWVLAWVGMVLVVFAANLVMVVLAIRTNPGLVVADYYERGQHYERTLVSKMANPPRRQTRIELPADLVVGEPSPVRVSILDLAGAPVAVEGATFFAIGLRMPARTSSSPCSGRPRVTTGPTSVSLWPSTVLQPGLCP